MFKVLLEVDTNVTQMASLESTGSPGSPGFQTITGIPSPKLVDNTLNTYYLKLVLPPSGAGNVWGCGVVIEYTRPAAETGILSMSGLAFDHPFEDGYNAGQVQFAATQAHFDNGSGAHGTYVAQVSLPHGAVVTKMTMYYEDVDESDHAINLYLIRSFDDVFIEMATIQSQDYAHKTADNTITYPTIDNETYSYWAYATLPPGNLRLWAVTIEYTLPAKDFGKLAISDAAFTPFYDGYDYENHGRWLFHKHSDAGGSLDGIYVAPVNLPHGATVDKVSFCYYDGAQA